MIKVQRIFLCCVATQKILWQPHFLLFSLVLFACFSFVFFCFFAKVICLSVATQNEPLWFRTFLMDRTKVDDFCLFTCVDRLLWFPVGTYLLKHCTNLRTEAHYYTLTCLLHMPGLAAALKITTEKVWSFCGLLCNSLTVALLNMFHLHKALRDTMTTGTTLHSVTKQLCGCCHCLATQRV